MYQDTKIKSYDAPVFPLNADWLKGFDWLEKYKTNSEASEKVYWHDEEVLNYFDKYGTKKFSKLNIWDIDWNKKAELLGRKGNYNDPRSKYEIFVHMFIERYREELKIKRTVPVRLVRLFGKTVLQVLGW